MSFVKPTDQIAWLGSLNFCHDFSQEMRGKRFLSERDIAKFSSRIWAKKIFGEKSWKNNSPFFPFFFFEDFLINFRSFLGESKNIWKIWKIQKIGKEGWEIRKFWRNLKFFPIFLVKTFSQEKNLLSLSFKFLRRFLWL